MKATQPLFNSILSLRVKDENDIGQVINRGLISKIENAYPQVRRNLKKVSEIQKARILVWLKIELKTEVLPALDETKEIGNFESWLQDNLHFGLQFDLERPFKIHYDANTTELSKKPEEFLREFLATEIYAFCKEKGLEGFNKCSQCGNWYMAGRRDSKACSSVCRNKAYRLRKSGKSHR